MSNGFLKFLAKHSAELSVTAGVMNTVIEHSNMPDEKKAELRASVASLGESAVNIAGHVERAKAAVPTREELRPVVASVASALASALIMRALTPRR